MTDTTNHHETSTQIIPFSFEGHDVRVLTQNDEPWWVATDICNVLDIAKTDRAVARLDSDEKGAHTMRTPGGKQELTIINESGLWSLVLTSRKPEAKRFKKWLTSEVIPSIRKHGGYLAAAPEETPEAIMARALRIADTTIRERTAQLEATLPKAQAYDELSRLSGEHSLRDSAKQCGWPEKRFIQKLLELSWLYASPITGRKCAYSTRIKSGYMNVKNVQIRHNSGDIEGVAQPMITQKGLTKLRLILGHFSNNNNQINHDNTGVA